MKILFAIPTLQFGGAESFIINLVNYLTVSSNHSIYLLNLNLYNFNDLNPLEERLMIKNINYIKLNNIYGRIYIISYIIKRFFIKEYQKSVARKTKTIINKLKPDIIHSNLSNCDRIITNLEPNIPVVITNHGCYSIKRIKDRDQILKKCDFIVCVSGARSNELNPQFKGRIKVIHNGYKKPPVSIMQVKRTDLGIPDNAFVFIMVARQVLDKGWIEALEAFHSFSMYYASYFIAVGDGRDSGYIKEYVINKGIERVIFTGFQENPQQYMAISNVALLPSYASYESLPISLIEAVYEGLPLIATRNGGIHELIEHPEGNAGILILLKNNKADVSQLVIAMNEMYKSYNNYKNNLMAVAEKFSIERCASSYLKLYEEIV